jgi:hypothetical protein
MKTDQVWTLVAGQGPAVPRWHGGRLCFFDWSAGEVVALDLAAPSEVIMLLESAALCTAG